MTNGRHSTGVAPLRCGVIGVNSRLERVIIPGLVAAPRATVAAVCSRDLAKAERVAGPLGALAFDDVAAMLDSVDAVIVNTPADLHRAPVETALRAGKHVMCEKPLAANIDDAEAMTRLARQSPGRTAVNFTYRTATAHRLVEQTLRENDLGPLLHFDFQYLQDRELPENGPRKDALAEIGPHAIDLLRWWGPALDTGEIARVQAQAGPHGSSRDAWNPTAKISAVVQVMLELAGGAVGTMTLSRVASGFNNAVRAMLYCRRGALSLEFDPDRFSLRIQHTGGGWESVPTPPELEVSYQDFPRVHFDRIAGALLGEESFPTFEDGLTVQRVLDGIHRSAATRSIVDLS